jgi:hypothetical protein
VLEIGVASARGVPGHHPVRVLDAHRLGHRVSPTGLAIGG